MIAAAGRASLSPEIEVRTADSIAVETPRSYMGRSRLKPLLKVTFGRTEEDRHSAAWLVSDLELWEQALKEAIRQ